MNAILQQTAVTLGSSPELSFILKLTLLVGLGLLATVLARRSRAATRHLLLTATFGALLTLPLALTWMPRLTIEVPAIEQVAPSLRTQAAQPVESTIDPASETAPVRPQVADTSGPSWLSMIRVAWAAGAIVFLLPIARSIVELRRIRRHALPWTEGATHLDVAGNGSDVARRVDVLLNEELPTPVTCGLVRPAVLLPVEAAQWSDADLRRALAHELEHVRRADWFVHLLARATCAIYWFHPLVWMAWRQLCLEAERTCDDAVLQQSEETAYAEQLVRLARRLQPDTRQPLLAMATRSDLSTRVKAILDLAQARGRRTGRSAAAIAVAAAALLLAIAPLRAVAVAVTTPVEDASQPSASPQSLEAQRAASTREELDRLIQRSDRLRALSASETDEGRLNHVLLAAAERGDVDGVASLIASGADVNAVLYGDGSPLIGAARRGRLAVAQQLLDAGADPNLKVDGDGSPLIMAAANGHSDIVELLLGQGAHIDQIVQGDENALIQASANGRLAMVQLLVARGADVHARVWAELTTTNGAGEWRTALSQARKNGHAAVVAYLQSVGAR